MNSSIRYPVRRIPMIFLLRARRLLPMRFALQWRPRASLQRPPCPARRPRRRMGNPRTGDCGACSYSGTCCMKNDPSGEIDTQAWSADKENVMFRRAWAGSDGRDSTFSEFQHACDLVVLATHGQDRPNHWLEGSIAETVFKRSAVPTLFVLHGARGIVDQASGNVRLRRVLVPVDHSPLPYRGD